MDNKPKFEDKQFRTASLCSLPPKIWGCVGVAMDVGGVAVRNTQDENKVTAHFSREEWRTFIDAVKAGEFDV